MSLKEDHLDEESIAEEDITELLQGWSGGDRQALGALMERVYDQLRAIASGFLRDERRDHTLQTAALVHETYLRLAEQERVEWQNRGHFYAIAARLMRRILVDHARLKRSAKRGWDERAREPLSSLDDTLLQRPEVLIDLDDALSGLAKLDPEQARIVEMNYFGGLSKERIAEALDLSRSTVTRRLRLARIWLHGEMSGATPPSAGQATAE